jgi:hypothetical protein
MMNHDIAPARLAATWIAGHAPRGHRRPDAEGDTGRHQAAGMTFLTINNHIASIFPNA